VGGGGREDNIVKVEVLLRTPRDRHAQAQTHIQAHLDSCE